jgi:hypothetical protein
VGKILKNNCLFSIAEFFLSVQSGKFIHNDKYLDLQNPIRTTN